jgi:hypothetical protein
MVQHWPHPLPQLVEGPAPNPLEAIAGDPHLLRGRLQGESLIAAVAQVEDLSQVGEFIALHECIAPIDAL